MLRRAAAGEPLHLALVGGSVTSQATGFTRGFGNRYFEFLNATFPPSGGRQHKLTGAGVGGIHAVAYDSCAAVFMPFNASLYVLELTLNSMGMWMVCATNNTGARAKGRPARAAICTLAVHHVPLVPRTPQTL